MSDGQGANLVWQQAAAAAVAVAAAAAASTVEDATQQQQHDGGDHGALPPPTFDDSSATADVPVSQAVGINTDESGVTSSQLAMPAASSNAADRGGKKGRASSGSAKAKGKQKESSTSGQASKDATDEQQVKKRRRVVVACDTCRRKKIRCQGLPNDTHTCDNCAVYGYKCAFTFSKSADGAEGSGAGSSGSGKGRTRGRYEILEAKVDSLLSIIRGMDPDVAARWESGELGAGAGTLEGVKKFSVSKTDPESAIVNDNSAGPSTAMYQQGDNSLDHASQTQASYGAYLHDNVFATGPQAEMAVDTTVVVDTDGQSGSAPEPGTDPHHGRSAGRDQRRGKAGAGGDAHASAGLLLHLSQAAVHVQERDQRAKDGPDVDDGAPAPEHDPRNKRSAKSADHKGLSHLLPDIEDGRPRYYGKSSTLHFFNALDSRPSSPPLDKAAANGTERHSSPSTVPKHNPSSAKTRTGQAPLYPLNSKQWVRLLRKKNLVAVGRDDDSNDPGWFHRYQLPEPHIVATLLATYFSTFHPLLPIVHRLSLERDLAFGRAEHDTAFRGLVFTLLAIASRLGTSEVEQQRLANLPAEDRKRELEELEARSDYYAAGSRMYHQVYAASLINVQVLLLTAAFMHGSIGAGTAWTVLGVGIRVLLDIGLHSERAYAGFSLFEQELRRRVFWCAFILDNIFAVNMGRPPALRLEECSVKLPLDVSEATLFDAEKGGPIDTNGPRGDQESPHNVMSGFIHLAKLNIVVADVLSSLYVSRVESPYLREQNHSQTRTVQPALTEKLLNRLLERLDDWVANIPKHLKGPRVEPMFKLQAGIITCGTHDIRLYIMKPFLQQPGMKGKLFPQCMDHARKLLDCVLKLFEDESLAGIVFIFQQAFWSAATFMITVWHHHKSASTLAADQHLIEGTLRILFSSDPQYYSSTMHRGLRLLQRIANRAMPEMEPARRERVSAYVQAQDLPALTELAPTLARPAYNIQPLPPQFGGHAGAAGAATTGPGAGPNIAPGNGHIGRDFQPWWPVGPQRPDGTDSAQQDGHPPFSIPAAGQGAQHSGDVMASQPWYQVPASSGAATNPSTFAPVSGAGEGAYQAQQASSGLPTSLAYYQADVVASSGPPNTASMSTPFPYVPQQSQAPTHSAPHSSLPPGISAAGPGAPMGMSQNEYAAAVQTRIAFENSFGDAHGIAGVSGPNPTLDDLAWTDYFASFLASLSDGQAVGPPQQAGTAGPR